MKYLRNAKRNEMKKNNNLDNNALFKKCGIFEEFLFVK